MPLPKSLHPLVQSRRFWTDCLWETETGESGYPELEGCTVDLPVGGGFGLSLSLDPDLCYFSLNLVSPDGQMEEIAWDDQAHWHPHVLRWKELELLCHAIAVHDAELSFPFPVLLLLYRFAPICEGDDVEAIVAMLERAWREIGTFSDAEIRAFIEIVDARDAGFQWRYRESVGGWCIEQEDRTGGRCLYTLRDARNADFPFQGWTQLLAEAKGALARSRVTSPEVEIPAQERQVHPKLMPREQHSLYLTLPRYPID